MAYPAAMEAGAMTQTCWTPGGVSTSQRDLPQTAIPIFSRAAKIGTGGVPAGWTATHSPLET